METSTMKPEDVKEKEVLRQQPGATGQFAGAADPARAEYGSIHDVGTATNAMDEQCTNSGSTGSSQWLLLMVCLIEGMDQQLLPVSFKAMETTMGMDPVSLAHMAICQGVALSISGPVWAAVVDAGASKRLFLMFGATLWGVATLMMACATSVTQVFVLRICVGVALASITPVVQAIVAEQGQEDMGYKFGLLESAMKVGAMIAILFVTPTAELEIHGVHGWRVAFGVVALLSFVIVGCLACCYHEKPRRWKPEALSVSAELHKFVSHCRIWTFRLTVLQGMFGMIPWYALTFLVMFLQYCGVSDVTASTLYTLHIVGAAFGVIVGGLVSDTLHRWNEDHGRVFNAQISVFSGIPLTVIIFYVIPPTASHAVTFGVLLFLMGLMTIWCGVGTNKPIMAALVDEESRGSIYVWLYSLENLCGTIVGPIVVGLLAEHQYGYKLQEKSVSEMTYDDRMTNADALRSSILVATVLPWSVCFIIYSAMHYCVPNDMRARESQRLNNQA